MLKDYNLDKLAQRVEGGSDSDGQKAEPILIAKAMTELQTAVTALQEQISNTGQIILSKIRSSTDKFSGSIDQLRDEIKKYSESSDRYANAMKWLTGALVLVGISNVIVSIVLN